MGLNDKNAQMPAFAWMFSVIIGAFILFFAFFFVFRFTRVAEQQEQAVTTTSLDILLEPFASSIAAGQSDIITLPQNAKLEIGCSYSDFDLGKNIVKYTTTGQFRFSKVVRDKYIFARPIQKRNILVVVLPFEMPFRIADLTMLIGKDYCIQGLPEEYKELLQELTKNSGNANINIEFDNCQQSQQEQSHNEKITVCKTDGSNCNCDVCFSCESGCSYGFVHYNDASYPWYGNLLFAAIFSDPDVYQCNVKRLLTRAKLIARVYKKHSYLLSTRGCSSVAGLNSHFENYIQELEAFNPTEGFSNIYNIAKMIDNINGFALCKVY